MSIFMEPLKMISLESSPLKYQSDVQNKKKQYYPFCYPSLKMSNICMYSRFSLSRLRLPRITTYLVVKIWSLSQHGNLIKYCEKEKQYLWSKFSSFPQYFQYS